MRLTAEERAMLDGDCGPGVKRAIEIVVALGKIYGADELVPVESVQVAGVSYKNLGPAGLDFLSQWVGEGARVRVPTFLNPAGMDLKRWRELGVDETFALRQLQVVEAFAEMGISTTCTCTPYFIGQIPAVGTHLAWAESSAVSFANSALGARTNREGGPSALAAAIAGRTAKYGLHCDENRLGSVEVIVGCPVASLSDWGALGFLVGKRAGHAVPFFRELSSGDGGSSPDPWLWEKLKALGAAMAASGAVSLYHIEGITPEAQAQEMLRPDHETFVVDSLEPAYCALSGDETATEIDLVWLGCPHASLQEVARLAAFAEGNRFRPEVWITTSRRVRDQAEAAGYVDAIEAAGGQVVADTCVIVAPVGDRFRTMATLSAKGGYYAPSYAGMQVRYGSWEQLQEVMLTGRWEAAR
jgi:predicted aconitase